MSSEDKVVSIMEEREPSSSQSDKSPARQEDPESDGDSEGQDESKRSWMNSTRKGKGSIGLKTASGKKVSISKSALLKAKLLFSAIDGEEANDDVTLSTGWSRGKAKEALLEEEEEEEANKENNVVLVSTTQITKKSTKGPLAPIRLLNSNGGGSGGGKKRFVPPFLVQATNSVIEIVASAKDKATPLCSTQSFVKNKAEGMQDESQKTLFKRPPQMFIPPKLPATADTLLDEEITACTNAFLGDNDEDEWF